jgi:ribonuclease BN (tRNA processing enzyme)
VSELRWKERKSVSTSTGKIDITAFRVKHWGARKQRDIYPGYNGYVLDRNNRRIIFSGDTALSDSFAELRASGPIDLAIMSIDAYNPWIHSHCTPEQAVQMADEAGAQQIELGAKARAGSELNSRAPRGGDSPSLPGQIGKRFSYPGCFFPPAAP